MSEADTHSSDDDRPEPDGGAVTRAGRDHRETDYLTQEVNLLRPSTPFMRDHLRVVRTGFVAWVLVVFGPVTATAVAPGPMTTQLPVLGFPLHYFLVAVGAPGGALVLSAWYARKRDALDEKYGIEHGAATGEAGSGGSGGAAVTDGGEGG
jgi:putative solute:sodium symporter small subunit